MYRPGLFSDVITQTAMVSFVDMTIPSTTTALTTIIVPVIILKIINQAFMYIPNSTSTKSTIGTQIGKFDKHGAISFSLVAYLFLYGFHRTLHTLHDYVVDIYRHNAAQALLPPGNPLRILVEMASLSMLVIFLHDRLHAVRHSHSSIVMMVLLGWLLVLMVMLVNCVFTRQPLMHPIVAKLKRSFNIIGGLGYTTMIAVVGYVIVAIYSKRYYIWHRNTLECNNTELVTANVGEFQYVTQHTTAASSSIRIGSLHRVLAVMAILMMFVLVQFRTLVVKHPQDWLYGMIVLGWSAITVDEEIKMFSCTQHFQSGTVIAHLRGLLSFFAVIGLMLVISTFPTVVQIRGIKRVHSTDTETVIIDNTNRLHYAPKMPQPDPVYFLNNRFVNTEFIGKSTLTRNHNIVPLLNGLSMLVLMVVGGIVFNRYRWLTNPDATDAFARDCPVGIYNHMCQLSMMKKSVTAEGRPVAAQDANCSIPLSAFKTFYPTIRLAN